MAEITKEKLLQLSDRDLQIAAQGDLSGLSEQGKRILGMGKSAALDMLDTGTSIAGSILGGVVAGPAGMIAGGAVGAGIGEAIENRISGDSGGVLKSMGVSAAFDVVTLGAGKILRPIAQMAKANLNTIFGKPATEITGELRRVIDGPAADMSADGGMAAALAQSQDVALRGGATLPPSVIPSVEWYRKTAEQIGKVGILTKNIVARDQENLLGAIRNSFKDLINLADDVPISPEDAGQRFIASMEVGRQAAMDVYGASLDGIQARLGGGSSIPNKGEIISSINKFIKANTPETIGKSADSGINNTILDDAVFNEAKEAIQLLSANSYTGNGLIAFQKKIRNSISRAYSSNDSNMARQLVELEDVIKGGVQKALDDIAPKVGSDYRQLNLDYAKTMRDMFPTVNETIVQNGLKNGRFSPLGNVLVGGSGTSEQAEAFMKSIDTSVFEIAKKDGKSVAWAREESERIKRQIRAGYIWGMTNELRDEKVMSKSFINNIVNTKNKAKMQAIFGDDWDQMKKAMNLAEIALKDDKGIGILSLAINGAQIAAAGNIAGQSMGYFGDGEISGKEIASAAFIIGSPLVFYKIATRPQAINRLIAFENGVKKKGIQNIKTEEVVSAVGKIMAALPKEDKDEARAIAQNYGWPIVF